MDTGSDFSAKAAQDWFAKLISAGTIKPSPILVPSAAMADTAAFFSRQGFKVKLSDPSEDALRQARSAVKQAGGDLAVTLRQHVLQLKAWNLGHVDHVVDHALLESLTPQERFGYSNRLARIVPTGGYLVGIFRIGHRDGEAPRPISLPDFKHMLFRYFVPEVFEPAGDAEPGSDLAYRGLLRRK